MHGNKKFTILLPNESSLHLAITEFIFLFLSINTNETSTHSIDYLVGFYEDDLPHPSAIDPEFNMW